MRVQQVDIVRENRREFGQRGATRVQLLHFAAEAEERHVRVSHGHFREGQWQKVIGVYDRRWQGQPQGKHR